MIEEAIISNAARQVLKPEKSHFFVIREGLRPTPESVNLVQFCAEELIPHSSWDGLGEYYRDHKNRIAFDLDYAHQFLPKGCKILEIGAYPYFLTLPLVQEQYDVTVLDKHSTYGPEVAQNWNLKVIASDIDRDRIPRPDNSFDTVIMNEVFEHLRINLIFSMREIWRVLKPGGELILSTPNLRSLRGIYNLLFREEAYACERGIYHNYSYLEIVDVMGHVREYTPKEIMDFIREIGFAPKGIIYRGRHSGSRFWRWSNYFTRLRPEFRPFFTVIAVKV